MIMVVRVSLGMMIKVGYFLIYCILLISIWFYFGVGGVMLRLRNDSVVIVRISVLVLVLV